MTIPYVRISNELGGKKEEREFPLAPMGVLAHRLPMLDRSLVPPSCVSAKYASSSAPPARLFVLVFLLLSEVLTFLPERRQLGFRNFACAPKSQKFQGFQ